ncbi:hypothetical protein [Fibrella aquatica]|uniref:hypothetical protein n=1 Tax=Fibrella aquatica TaxID=3242487 RepID=UPI003522F95B
MRKASHFLYALLATFTLSIQSCNQETPEKQPLDSVKHSARFIAQILVDKQAKALSGQAQFDYVKSQVKEEFEQELNYEYNDYLQLKSKFNTAHAQNDMSLVFFDSKARTTSEGVSRWAVELNEELQSVPTQEILEVQLNERINEIAASDLSDEEKYQLYLQIEVIREVSRIGDADDAQGRMSSSLIRCRGFLRKLCVALNAGLAAAVVASSFGAAVLAGISFGLIAACCYCGCDCGGNIICTNVNLAPSRYKLIGKPLKTTVYENPGYIPPFALSNAAC